MGKRTTFGKNPERLSRLLALGLDQRKDQKARRPSELVTLDDFTGEQPGTRIGKYTLLEALGEGGMGIVHLAEQKRPVRRKVALKVIKPGMDSKRIVARFEAEQQALALMQHPHIARVFDAGLTEMGRPYFVMEYVNGVPLTEYCDCQKLSIEARLDLFLSVCEAIKHAHHKGVTHRDIKPSNILVMVQDDAPITKVIDFGIARATTQSLTDRTLHTEHGQMIGTPEYMSPEQAGYETDIDTRTDVYSLGAVLYKLLSGLLPFNSGTLRDSKPDDLRRIICEQDPKTPSTRLKSVDHEEVAELAAQRGCETRSMCHRLKGDLDWIVLKAMEKDRNRRYSTVEELVLDIQRHLKHEPIMARPPQLSYRLGKFLRRNRVKVIAACAAILLVLALALSSSILRRGLEEGRRAQVVKQRGILAESEQLRHEGKYEQSLARVSGILDSPTVGAEARLLKAQLLVLNLQASSDLILPNTEQWQQAIGELESLLDREARIAGPAHFLLAQLYFESNPEDPSVANKAVKDKWAFHKQQAEQLLGETADGFYLKATTAGTVPKMLTLLDSALEIDAGHYEALKTRTYLHQAAEDFHKMAMDASQLKALQPGNPLGYSLSAIAQRELGWFEEAVADHARAIELSPDDPAPYDRRRRTYMQMGDYEHALADAEQCVSLEPTDNHYRFHVYCAQLALGRYDQAAQQYRNLMSQRRVSSIVFTDWAVAYVFDRLSKGLDWHGSAAALEARDFLPILEAEENYRQLAAQGKRIIAKGYHASWSPDGMKLAYSIGVGGSSGIAVYDLQKDQSTLITLSGSDPAWSPDGRYLAYIKNRDSLSAETLVHTEKRIDYVWNMQFQVYVIKADGTEDPFWVANGEWPAWRQDSRHVFYVSRQDRTIYSKPIREPSAQPTVIARVNSTHPGLSYDNRFIADFSGAKLVIVDANVGATEFENYYTERNPQWLPNQQEIVYASPGRIPWLQGLWLYHRDSDTHSQLLKGAFDRATMVATANGGCLAFEVRLLSSRQIWIADVPDYKSALGEVWPTRSWEQHHREVDRILTRRLTAAPDDARLYVHRASHRLSGMHDLKNALADVARFARLERGSDVLSNRLLEEQLNELISALCQHRASEDLGEFERQGLAWTYFYRGWYREVKHQYQEAMTDYTKALELYPDCARAHNRLADVKATCPVAQFRDSVQALKHAQNARTLTQGQDAEHLDTLAAAFAAAGEFDNAVKWQQTSLDKAASSARDTEAPQAKLALYQRRRAYQRQYLFPNTLIARYACTQDDTEQLTDSSGHDLHGHFHGEARVVMDPIRGYVLSLDGNGDWVDCGHHARFAFKGPTTICCWIKTQALNRQYQTIMAKGDRSWLISRDFDRNCLQAMFRGIDCPANRYGKVEGTVNINDGQWHHVVAVYDGSAVKLYHNGTLNAQTPATGTINVYNWPLWIGANAEKPGREWNGLIDDIQLYSYALTESDIKRLFAGQDPITPQLS
jgi:serine/threonine protein kinase/tetratricopeptide (TPR) repeat protein